VGGLEHRYLRFAEMALAARVHAHGFRLGYAPEAVVTHYNATKLASLLEYVWEYRQQACAFNRDYPGLLPDGAPAEGTSAAVRRTLSRCVWQTFRESLRRLGTKEGRALARTMLAAGLRQPFGRRWRRERARLRYWLARLRLAGALREETRYAAFMQVWERLGDYAVVDYLDRHGSTEAELPTPVHDDCRPGELNAERFVGFHEPESWNGQCFRWTGPVACLAVDRAPANLVVTLDTRGLRCPGPDEVRLFWNAVPAVPDPAGWEDGCLRFRVGPHVFVRPGPQLLTLTCSRLAGCGKHESRILGLPLFAIEFQVEPAAASCSTGQPAPSACRSASALA
jgi:hypothetical protein